MRNTFLAMEQDELEINKLLDHKEEPSSEYDELYETIKTKEQIRLDKEEQEDDANDNDDDSGAEPDSTDGEPSDDSGADQAGDDDAESSQSADDADTGEPKEPSSESKPESDKSTESKEPTPKESSALESSKLVSELRNYDASISLAQEGAIMTGARKLTGLAIDAAASIASLGVEYTPKIASAISKGVVFAIARTAKLLYSGYDKLTVYLEEREKSLSKLDKDIASLKKAVGEIKSISDEEKLAEIESTLREHTFDNKAVINALKISSDVDFSKNIKVLEKFLSTSIGNLAKISDIEYNNIKTYLDVKSTYTTVSKDSLLPDGLRGLLTGSSVKGFDQRSDDIDTISFRGGLPGDITLIAYVPKKGLDTMDAISSAYTKSKLFLGLDAEKFVEVDKVDYMEVTELDKFLDSLSSVVTLSKQHHAYYMKIRKDKERLRGGLRSYLLNLSKSVSKVDPKDTMADAIEMKLQVLDKMYLSGAMDIHNYVSDTVSKATSFAADNIKRLT